MRRSPRTTSYAPLSNEKCEKRNSRRKGDEGTISLLTLGFLMIGALLLVVVIDVSAVFNARRSLLAKCDAAALHAAQSLDADEFYRDGADEWLPLGDEGVQAAVGSEFFARTDGTTVWVHGVKWVDLPFLPRVQRIVTGPIYAKADCSTVAHRR